MSHSDSGEDTSFHIWPYAPKYDRGMREGHLYPAPRCGSPAIIWQMALAPLRRFGDRDGASKPWRGETLSDAHRIYDEDFEQFVEELNALARRLQERGRVSRAREFSLRALAEDSELWQAAQEASAVFEDQELGEAGADGAEADSPADAAAEPDYDAAHRFLTAAPQTLSFILWWSDTGQTQFGEAAGGEQILPGAEDLRIEAHIQIHTGYATVLFVLDAAKPYGAAQSERAPRPEGAMAPEEAAAGGSISNEPSRRNRIRRALNIIRSSMTRQIRLQAVDQQRLPEQEVGAEEARDLKDAADYLFKGVWDDFVQSFGLTMLGASKAGAANSQKKKEQLGRRFVDLRGHVMSVAGLVTPEDLAREHEANELRGLNTVDAAATAPGAPPSAAELEALERWKPGYGLDLADKDMPKPLSGASGFGRFDTFDAGRNEGNTVLKSLWPFLRRMSPWADFREIVGCGVMNWRALYVSTLGFDGQAPSFQDEMAERFQDVPARNLPDLEDVWTRTPNKSETSEYYLQRLYRAHSRPQRFLLVTKNEPHREQLGRFVERYTALETLRFFALRNITAIRNGGVHLELISRMLDGLLEHWSHKRAEVEADYNRDKAVIDARAEVEERYWAVIRGIRSLYFDFARSSRRAEGRYSALEDAKNDAINQLIKDTDREVIRLTAALDKVGEGGAGRIMYAIRRAELAIDDFKRMLPTMSVGEIDGWTSYAQFVRRGLAPSFGFVRLTGERLNAIRMRLQTVTETIQTAALIAEAEATKLNTQTLRDIARFFFLMQKRLLWMFFVAIALLAEWYLPNIIKPSRLIDGAVEYMVSLIS